MSADESKAESFRACLIFVALLAVILTAPKWMPVLDEMLEPRAIVVMECSR